MDFSKFRDETLLKLQKGEELDPTSLTDDELVEIHNNQTRRPSAPVERPGVLEALGRSIEQGALANFGDEVNAGIESFVTGKPYKQAVEESRAKFKAAEEEYPKLSFAGNLAGGVAPALLTGGGAPTAMGAIKAGAAFGAISGVGANESGDLRDIASEAALGGALGGGLGKVAHEVAPAISKVAGYAAKIPGMAADMPIIRDVVSGVEQGLKGRRLFGKSPGNALNEEIRQLRDSIAQGLDTAKFQAGKDLTESLEDASPKAIKDWYKSSKDAINGLKKTYGKNEVALRELNQIESSIDDAVLGKLEVPVSEKVPSANKEEIDKLYQKLAQLNAGREVEQKLVSDALDAPERLFASETLPNKFDESEAVEYMTKGGKLSKAQVMERDFDTGEPVGKLRASADAMETAQRDINEKFVLQGLPYKAQVVDTKTMGPVVTIIDMTTNKPIGKPVSLEKFTKGEYTLTDKGVQTVAAMSPENVGTMPAQDVQRLKMNIADRATFGSSPAESYEARALSNRLLSPSNRTDMGGVDKTIDTLLGEKFDPLKTILERDNPKYADANKRYSNILKAQELQPSILQQLGTEGAGPTATNAYMNTTDFMEALPSELKNKFAGQLKDLEQARQVRHEITKQGLGHGLFEIVGAGGAKGVLSVGANAVGLAGRGLYDLAPEALSSIGNAVAKGGTQTHQTLAAALNEASKRDKTGRTALIFAIEQNPEYRKMLNSVTSGGKDERRQ